MKNFIPQGLWISRYGLLVIVPPVASLIQPEDESILLCSMLAVDLIFSSVRLPFTTFFEALRSLFYSEPLMVSVLECDQEY